MATTQTTTRSTGAIRAATLSRRAIADPVVAQLVNDIADAMKLDIAAAFAAGAGSAGGAGGRVGAAASRLFAARRPGADALLTPALRTRARELGVATGAGTPATRQVDFAARFRARGLPTGRQLADLLVDRLAGGGAGQAPAAGIVANKGARFRVHRVRCVEETAPRAIGKDEIAMGGVALAADGAETTIAEFLVGKFNGGDEVVFDPPKALRSFTLGTTFPQQLTVLLGLAEKDRGGFSAFLTALFEAIEAEVGVILTAVGAAAGAAIGAGTGGTVGGQLGAAVGGPIGVVIGVVAGLILGALVGFVAGAARDEIFEPQVALLALDAPDATFPDGGLVSPLLGLTYADHGGQYRVDYSWELQR